MRKKYRPLLIRIFLFLVLHFTGIASPVCRYSDDLLTCHSINPILQKLLFIIIILIIIWLAMKYHVTTVQHNDFYLYRN